MAAPHLPFGVAATLGKFLHSPMPPLLQAFKTCAVASLWTKYLQVPFNCRLSLPSHLPSLNLAHALPTRPNLCRHNTSPYSTTSNNATLNRMIIYFQLP